MVQLTSVIASTLLLFPLLSTALPYNVETSHQNIVRDLEEVYGREFLLELRDLHNDLDARSWASVKNAMSKVGQGIKRAAKSPLGRTAAAAGIGILAQAGLNRVLGGRELDGSEEISVRELEHLLYGREMKKREVNDLD